MINIFNSFSSKKERLQPHGKNLVRIFICGPTVYDLTHVGHARIFLTYDLLCRHLKDRGCETDVLVNMTDINQSVFNKAKVESRDFRSVARYYADQFAEDLGRLNVNTVTRMAFVSDYVDSMQNHISEMLRKGVAYVANGNVYLDTSKVQTYGMLSKQSREDLLLHRLDIGPHKKSQNDIMLWNCSEIFDFTWPSKFGDGIPWWHIQDTTVAFENFGQEYEIHGGARELVYPHHEAHLAQYQVLSGLPNPVQAWMYVGLVLAGSEKMSKSLGNVIWSREMVEKYGQNLLRLYLFSYHYSEDVQFDEEKLASRSSLMNKIYLAGQRVAAKSDGKIIEQLEEFSAALDDDLDSPRALEVMEKICDDAISGRNLSSEDFEKACQVLGIRT